MVSLFCFSLGLLGLPMIVGFVQGFIESIRGPRPRLRIFLPDSEG